MNYRTFSRLQPQQQQPRQRQESLDLGVGMASCEGIDCVEGRRTDPQQAGSGQRDGCGGVLSMAQRRVEGRRRSCFEMMMGAGSSSARKERNGLRPNELFSFHSLELCHL
jgi:hypothetical protein